MNLLFSTFFIVRLITKSNHYNEKSSGLSGVMLMVIGDAIQEGRFHCAWHIAGNLYVVCDDCGRGI